MMNTQEIPVLTTEGKKKFNIILREAKSFEKAKQPLQALWKYFDALQIAQKPKLFTKMIKLRKICAEMSLGETEEALRCGQARVWFYNVVTKCYHLRPNSWHHHQTTNDNDNNTQNHSFSTSSQDTACSDYILSDDTFLKLYQYQRDALAWFWNVYQSPNGGILGDDMGLGKTVQMSAYLRGVFHSKLVRCVLLVVPVSMMSHWSQELERWCPLPSGYRIKKYHSSISEKRRQENIEYIARRGGILITSYGMVQKRWQSMDLRSYHQKVSISTESKCTQSKTSKIGGNDPMTKRKKMNVNKGNKQNVDKEEVSPSQSQSQSSSPWDYMILDEGHMIKNQDIGVAQAVRDIPVRDSNRILLSGTFLQNELSELWSLFDFISESKLFGSHSAFNEQFANPINAGRMRNATVYQQQKSVELTNVIKQMIAPYLLRRMKQSMAGDMTQTEGGMEVTYTSAASIIGNGFVDTGIAGSGGSGGSQLRRRASPGLQCEKRELVVWIKMTTIQTNIYRSFLESDAVKDALNTTKSPLAALTVLKKICNSPFLLDDVRKSGTTNNTIERGVDKTVETSSKMGVLITLLSELVHNHKHRVLVFSQYKTLLSMMEPVMNAIGMKYIRMDGETKIEDRQKMVDQFNQSTDLNVFLLSTKVGGLGLNLTGSDRVIIYDPAWNPATDAQAVDRSYRIGQVNDVMVYRFVTCGTVEEKIYRRQISKVGLLKSMTGHSNQQRYFSKEELKKVFELGDPKKSETQIQLQKQENEQNEAGTEHQVFDRETQFVEGVDSVFGVSRHDLLFKEICTERLGDAAFAGGDERIYDDDSSDLNDDDSMRPFFSNKHTESRISGKKRKRDEYGVDDLWYPCQ